MAGGLLRFAARLCLRLGSRRRSRHTVSRDMPLAVTGTLRRETREHGPQGKRSADMPREPIVRSLFRATVVALSAALVTACKTLPLPQPIAPAAPQASSSCAAPPWMNPMIGGNDLGAIPAQLAADRENFGKALGLIIQSFRSQISPTVGHAETRISVSDLKSFASNVHDILRKANTPSTGSLSRADASLFPDALAYYLRALFQGQYVDRFGNKLAAPTIVSTISDSDITSVLDVLLDAIGDYLWRSPVWVDNADNPTKFYPAALVSGANSEDNGLPRLATSSTTPAGAAGASGSQARAPGASTGASTPSLEPTALAFNRDPTVQKDHPEVIDNAHGTVTWADLRWTPIVALEPPGTDTGCGLDERKLEVVEYVSQLAGQEASAVTGFSLGSFGGWGFSLGPYLKFSIGDNQTLQAIARALLSKAAERLIAEAAYRAAFYVDDNDTSFAKMAAQMPALAPLK